MFPAMFVLSVAVRLLYST